MSGGETTLPPSAVGRRVMKVRPRRRQTANSPMFTSPARQASPTQLKEIYLERQISRSKHTQDYYGKGQSASGTPRMTVREDGSQ